MLLELVRRLLHQGSRGLREILTQARDRLPLLIDLSLEAFGVLLELAADLDHQLTVARLEALQLRVEPGFQLLDVTGPVGDPLLDRSLNRDQLVAEL